MNATQIRKMKKEISFLKNKNHCSDRSENLCKSFSPNIDNRSQILILGSMPGIKSLEEKQYYAHPQNRFWKLMGLFCNTENLHTKSYSQKLQILLQNGFALWDVLQSCNRNGSLDSNIQNEIPNNIPQLLKQYNNIKIICLNGNKAYSAFKKHFPNLSDKYICYKLPSTSPANAKYKLEDLYKEWNNAFLEK